MERLSDPIASIEEYRAVGGMRGLERALSTTPEAVIEEVEASGLRGRGGAGFPTGSKWRSIRNDGAGTRFVVANGAEGEPATFKDRWLMRRNPYAVVEGLAIASYAVGAAKSYVGVKQSFEREGRVRPGPATLRDTLRAIRDEKVSRSNVRLTRSAPESPNRQGPQCRFYECRECRGCRGCCDPRTSSPPRAP